MPKVKRPSLTVILGWSDALTAWLVQTAQGTYFVRNPPPGIGALDKSRRYRGTLVSNGAAFVINEGRVA